jgi:hypothetical protein
MIKKKYTIITEVSLFRFLCDYGVAPKEFVKKLIAPIIIESFPANCALKVPRNWKKILVARIKKSVTDECMKKYFKKE